MFVSSYNTYVNTNNSAKDSKEVQSTKSKDGSSFSAALFEKSKSTLVFSNNIPIDYVSKNKAFYTKVYMEMQRQESQESKKLYDSNKKFVSFKTLGDAKQAYADNSKIFSLMRIPHATQDQTPKIDKKLPYEIQELKEKNLRHIMVNTYIQNDKYYQITA